MSYTFEGKILHYNGAKIYEAPTDITSLFNDTNSNQVFIIYRGRNLLPNDYHDIMNPKIKDPKLQEAINQNVLCIDKEGNIVWRIESTLDYPEDHVRFTKNPPNNEDVWVYRRDAWEFQIDPKNGKILQERRGL